MKCSPYSPFLWYSLGDCVTNTKFIQYVKDFVCRVSETDSIALYVVEQKHNWGKPMEHFQLDSNQFSPSRAK